MGNQIVKFKVGKMGIRWLLVLVSFILLVNILSQFQITFLDNYSDSLILLFISLFILAEVGFSNPLKFKTPKGLKIFGVVFGVYGAIAAILSLIGFSTAFPVALSWLQGIAAGGLLIYAFAEIFFIN